MPPLPSKASEQSEVDPALAEGLLDPAPAAPVPPPAPVSAPAIEVVALRNGFYKQERKVAGDKFTIPSLDKAGEWMKCVNPKIEREHQAKIKARKQAASK